MHINNFDREKWIQVQTSWHSCFIGLTLGGRRGGSSWVHGVSDSFMYQPSYIQENGSRFSFWSSYMFFICRLCLKTLVIRKYQWQCNSLYCIRYFSGLLSWHGYLIIQTLLWLEIGNLLPLLSMNINLCHFRSLEEWGSLTVECYETKSEHC